MKRKQYQRGLRTPRVLVYLLGRYHGRITKTAAVDPNTGRLVSGYAEVKRRQLAENAAEAVVDLELGLRSTRTEAHRLLAEKARLQQRLAALPEDGQPENDLRQAERLRQQKAALHTRLDQITARLQELCTLIASRELCCTERLEQAAHRLQRLLAAYTHGAMRGPITAECVPPVEPGDALAGYHAVHKKGDEQIKEEI